MSVSAEAITETYRDLFGDEVVLDSYEYANKVPIWKIEYDEDTNMLGVYYPDGLGCAGPTVYLRRIVPLVSSVDNVKILLINQRVDNDFSAADGEIYKSVISGGVMQDYFSIGIDNLTEIINNTELYEFNFVAGENEYYLDNVIKL